MAICVSCFDGGVACGVFTWPRVCHSPNRPVLAAALGEVRLLACVCCGRNGRWVVGFANTVVGGVVCTGLVA